MGIRIFLLTIILINTVFAINAQTTKDEMIANPNKTGGVYYAYPTPSSAVTPAPKGYKPFYISHYGRHGSRYLISTKDYTNLKDQLHNAYDAGALTPFGVEIMNRLDTVMIEADGRGGDLAPLGVRQHREIAERMVNSYPEVFQDSTNISARSTLVVRCVLSMDAFCERLKEINPSLQIIREASQKYMPYLCYGSPESDEKRKEISEEKRKFKNQMTHPERLIDTLFFDKEYVRKNLNPEDFMWGMYYLASDMQNMETPISFYDVFTPDELFDLWQVFNFDFYSGSANYKGSDGLMIANAGNLLNNIMDSAEIALDNDSPSATLRFGHDGNLIPLAGILEFPSAIGSNDSPSDAYKYFADYKVAPMAGNIQIIFYKNEASPDAPVLVKFLLNEEEQIIPIEPVDWPYYDWEAVKAHYRHSKFLQTNKSTLNDQASKTF